METNTKNVTGKAEKTFKPDERMDIEITNSKFHDKGKVIRVHPVLGEKLIKQGKAKKVEAKEKTTK